MISRVSSISDVKELTWLFVGEGVNFHPDDDFRNYVRDSKGIIEPLYSDEEAELRNLLVNKCFEVCSKYGVDIYDVMLEEFLIATGMNKYIPLPSETI